MRYATLLLFILISACAQNPAHVPTGEDDAQQAHAARGNEYTNPKLGGMLPHQRTEDIRNQNIMIEVRFVEAQHHRAQLMAIGVRSGSKDRNTRVRVTGSELFGSNGLNLSVMGARYAVPFFATQRETRGNVVVGNFLSVRNGGRGGIAGLNTRATRPFVVRTPKGNIVADERSLTGARIVVEPEIIDSEKELIRVKVWPELAGMLRNGGIDTSSLQSTAVLENGGALVIGGDTEQGHSLGYELFSKNIGGSDRQMLIIARVRY